MQIKIVGHTFEVNEWFRQGSKRPVLMLVFKGKSHITQYNDMRKVKKEVLENAKIKIEKFCKENNIVTITELQAINMLSETIYLVESLHLDMYEKVVKSQGSTWFQEY